MTLQDFERHYKATDAENINDLIWAISSYIKQVIPTHNPQITQELG